MVRPLSFCAAVFSRLFLVLLVAAGFQPRFAESSEDGSLKALDAQTIKNNRILECIGFFYQFIDRGPGSWTDAK